MGKLCRPGGLGSGGLCPKTLIEGRGNAAKAGHVSSPLLWPPLPRAALWRFPAEGPCLSGLIRSSSFGTACSECRGWAHTAPLTHSLGTRPIWEWSRGPGSRTPQCPFHHGVPTKPGESRSADRGLPCNDQLALYRLLRAAGETSKTRKTLSQGRSSVNES